MAAEMMAHCASRLSTHKVPTIVAFVTASPRTSTGKIKKQLLC